MLPRAMKKRPARQTTRREILKHAAVAGATPLLLQACGPGQKGPEKEPPPPERPVTDPQPYDQATATAFNPQAVPVDDQVFSMGVQAGAAETTAATFWSHTSNGQPMTLRVWREGPDTATVMLVHQSTVQPNDGGFLKQRVSNLAPDTVYSYTFTDAADTRRSLLGRLRTAYPEDYLWPITVAAATCTKVTYAPWEACRIMGQREHDLLLHLGDFSYNDGASTLEEYRTMWRRSFVDPGYQALLPNVGSYVVWDDHEFANNFNPETMDPGQMAAARTAFYETTPAEPGPDGRLWRSYRWGRTAEFFLLDCRTERVPSLRMTPQAQYLSTQQMAWFKQALVDSPAHFKVVLNSVPMVDFPDTFWASVDDRWEGYQSQRQELVDHLEAHNLDNVWFLSGDFHLAFISRLAPQGIQARLFDIAVGPTGNQNNPLVGVANMSEQLREEIFPSNQFLHFHADLAATTLVFDPIRDEVRITYTNAVTGEVIFDGPISRRS